MRAVALALATVTMIAVFEPASAQTSNSLVGSWLRIEQPGGRSSPTAFLIFSADGFYSQTAIPRDRPKTNKSLSQLTIKELLARFENAEARYGRYAVSGNRLSRTSMASLEPNSEGGPAQIQHFRIQGNILILRGIGNDRTETRFRRMQ